MLRCRGCPVPLTVRGTQALVSFAPLAFKLFYAARQNAVLRRSPFPTPYKRFSRSPRSDEHLFKPIRAYLAAKLPPTLWGQPPARAARGCAAGGSRRLPRRHPTGSPCTWRVATLATPSAGCNQQVRAGRNGSAPIRCPGTSIHLSAVVVRVRGADRRGLLLCINNVTTPPAS